MGLDQWRSGGPPAVVARSRATPPHAARHSARAQAGARATADSSWPGRPPAVPPGHAAPGHAPPRHAAPRHASPPITYGGPLGDRRGLTAAGAAVLMLLFGGLGAGIDLLLGHRLWMFFSIGFVGATVLAALRVHIEDLAAAVVLPPLAYAALATLVALLDPLAPGDGVKQALLDTASTLVFSAPVLLLATGLALVLACYRGISTAVRRRARTRTRLRSR